MSLIRTCLMLGAVVMLLPSDEKQQTGFSATASDTAARTASFCTRNPSTCEAGREMWALFLRKAEYGMELSAKLIRDQLLSSSAEPSSAQPAATPVPAALEPYRPSQTIPVPIRNVPAKAAARPEALAQPHGEPQPRRNSYSMDHPSRWR